MVLGYTRLTENEVYRLAASLGQSDFRGIDYHILTRYLSCTQFNRNCNHFADKLTKALCGVSIPKWINRLAYLGNIH
jgi:hypothetical protein